MQEYEDLNYLLLLLLRSGLALAALGKFLCGDCDRDVASFRKCHFNESALHVLNGGPPDS